MDGSSEIWERQRDAEGQLEPVLWWRRFEGYRLMGPGRSFSALYDEYRAQKGAPKRNGTGIPASWRKRAKEWSWTGRAEAWDVHEAVRECQEREEEGRRNREQARETRRQLLSAGHNLLARTMLPYLGKQGATPDAQTAARLLRTIVYYNADSRSEYGDLPATALQVSGPDGGPVVVVAATAAFEGMSDDELRRIIGLSGDTPADQPPASGTGGTGAQDGETQLDQL